VNLYYDARIHEHQILGGQCKEKCFHTNMCLILNGYRDRAVWIYRPNSVRHLFVRLD